VEQSATVLRYQAFAVLMASVVQMPSALLQGAGRPDLTAKIQGVELPVYSLLMWQAVRLYGINGAAVVWTIRVTLLSVIYYWFSARLLRSSFFELARTVLLGGCCMALLAVATLPHGLPAKFGVLVAVGVPTVALIWRALPPREWSHVFSRRSALGGRVAAAGTGEKS
jgi:O-antigen/teichoic acid export membrane protein